MLADTTEVRRDVRKAAPLFDQAVPLIRKGQQSSEDSTEAVSAGSEKHMQFSLLAKKGNKQTVSGALRYWCSSQRVTFANNYRCERSRFPSIRLSLSILDLSNFRTSRNRNNSNVWYVFARNLLPGRHSLTAWYVGIAKRASFGAKRASGDGAVYPKPIHAPSSRRRLNDERRS
jgi:hypothetical protein